MKISTAHQWIIALGTAFMLWAVITPVGSTPDEPAHMVYAWGIATGQGVGGADIPCGEAPGPCPASLVDIPDDLIPWPTCYKFDPAVTAECAPTRPAGEMKTAAVRYPPPYYAIVGAGLRIGRSLDLSAPAIGLIGRMLSAMISLSILLPAMLRVSAVSKRVLATIIVSLTPMAFFTMSSVNPSGVETAAAIGVAAGFVLLSNESARLRHASIVLCYSMFWLAWSRPLGVLWASTLLVAGSATLVASGRARVRAAMPPLVVSAIVVVSGWLWFFYSVSIRRTGAPDAGGVTVPDSGSEQFIAYTLRWGDMLSENLGTLGWLDTRLPAALILVLATCFALVVFGPRAPGPTPPAVRIAIVYLGCILVGVTTIMWRTEFLWQGRYVLPPLAGGFVLLSGASTFQVDDRLRWPVITSWLATLVGGVWLGSRYVYGLQRGPRHQIPNLSASAQWLPVGGPMLALILLAVAALSGSWLFFRTFSSSRVVDVGEPEAGELLPSRP